MALTGAGVFTQGPGRGGGLQPPRAGASPQSQPALDLAHAILVPGPSVRMAFEGQPLGVVPQVTGVWTSGWASCQSHFNKFFVLTLSSLRGAQQVSSVKEQTVNNFNFAVSTAARPLNSVL